MVWSLAQLGMYELTPPEFVSCAAAAGFDAVGIKLNSNRPDLRNYPIIGDTPMLRETVNRLDDTGVTVSDVTSLRMTEDFDFAEIPPLFESANRLGAKSFVVIGGDADHARTAETFGRLCQLAAPFGLTIDLEFMMYSAIKTLADGLAIVRQADQPNGGILIDCLHLSRAGTAPSTIQDVEKKYLNIMQLCDALAQSPPPSGLPEEARHNRLPAGQGGLNLAAIMQFLPSDIEVSVEIPLAGQLGALPVRERAQLLHDTSRSFLKSVKRAS
jgi:sugar phosphate isomerase/epimerase